ncbi:MAG TPA: PAS domain S-box protein [Acidimicrobiia bacterium]|nr:PAS domain S-box protein [Acidimicrobiia bacterium]
MGAGLAGLEALELVPDPVVVVDDGLRVVAANRVAERFFGAEGEHWIGRVPLDLVHPDDVALVVSSHAEVVHKEIGTPIEVRVRVADGTYRLTEIVGGAHEASTGRLVVLTFRDLTQRRRWEVAANRPEVFRSLVECAAVIVVLLDAGGVVDSVSGAFDRELGHDPARVVGRELAEFVVEHDRGSYRSAFRAACARPGKTVVDVELGRRDGSAVPYELSILNLLDDPVLCGLVVTAVDITERREAAHALALSARRLEALLDNLSEIVTVIDRNGNMTYLSGSTTALLGRHVDDRLGRSIFDFVHPEDAGRVAETFTKALSTSGSIAPFEVRVLHEDGTYHLFETRANSMFDDPAIGGIIVSSRDLTDRRHIETSLHQAEARFEQVFENAAVGMTLVDAQGRFTRVNAAYGRMLGMTAPEILARTIYDVSEPADIERTRLAFGRLWSGVDDSYTLDKRLRRADGDTLWTRICASLVRDEDGEGLYAIGLVLDTSEIHRLTEQLTHEASHDPLTGLAARSILDDHLARCLADAARTESFVGLLLVDLDDFKQINDRFGHLAGDEVLVEVAVRLRSVVRATDLIVRFGGDEFIIVLHPMTGVDTATHLARRIVERLAEPFHSLGTATYIGASVGITLTQRDEPDTGALIAQADTAAYEAKQRGKNQFVVFNDLHHLPDRAARRAPLHSE